MNSISTRIAPYWWVSETHQDSNVSRLSSDQIQEDGEPRFVVMLNNQLVLIKEGYIQSRHRPDALPCFGTLLPPCKESLGDSEFLRTHGVGQAYMIGAMANGISSSELVIAAGKNKYLASFGSGGLPLDAVEQSIFKIQSELKTDPYAFNLLNNPHDSEKEMALIKLYLKHKVRTIEASAFIKLSLPLVYYRVSGFQRDSAGRPLMMNKVIGKVSRPEVAELFLKPAPEEMVNELLSKEMITHEQAELSRILPVAGDITVEADSGGHTDNRPLVSLFPLITNLRDSIQNKFNYEYPVRIGAAGGISTPESAIAAFSMGAAYIVTGSINQSSVEAATSYAVKEMLSKAEMSDVAMAPAADMFELGAQVQVLKKGTMYALNARKLGEIFQRTKTWNELAAEDRELLESRVFRKPLDEVWEDTKQYLSIAAPSELIKAQRQPRHKLALVMRWYLGKSSKWAVSGEKERLVDFQIWCGQSMGAFNSWVRGSALENLNNRSVVGIGEMIMQGAAKLSRVQQLKEVRSITQGNTRKFSGQNSTAEISTALPNSA